MDDIESIIQSMIDAGEPEEKIEEAVRLYREREAGNAIDSPAEIPAVESSTGLESGDGSSVLLDRLETGDLGEEPKDEVEQLKQIPGYYDKENLTPDLNIGYFPVDQDISGYSLSTLMNPTDQVTNQVAEFYTTQENQYQKDKHRLSQIDNPEAKAYQEQNNPENLTQLELDAKNYGDMLFFAEPDFLGGNAPKEGMVKTMGGDDVYNVLPLDDMYGVERSDDFWDQSEQLLDAREAFMLAETKKAKGHVFSRNNNDPLLVDREISNYSPNLLSEEDQEIQTLIRQGDQPGADKLAEEKGYVKLLNIDGSFKDYMPAEMQSKAIDKATSTGLDDLKTEQREIYSRMIAAQKLAARNTTGGMGNLGRTDFSKMPTPYGVGITDHIVGIMHGGLQSGYLMSNAARATGTNAEANQLIKKAERIPGSSPIAEEHNRILDELRTITQAIELNVNPELLPEGNAFFEPLERRAREIASNIGFMGVAAEKEDLNDQRAEIFHNITDRIGLKPKSEFKREGDYYGREVVEGSRDFVDSFAELAAAIYITKRLPVGVLKKGKDIVKLEAAMTTGVNNLNKAIKASTNSRVVAGISEVGLGAVKEIVTLGGADVIGDHLFGSEGFVYNKKTKDFHLAFPAALGAGNVISKKIMEKVLRTESSFTRTLGRLNKGVENGTLSAIGTATAGAVTGTAVLTFGELVAEGLSSEQQYREMEDGKFETIDEWKEIVGGRKLLETFIGMYMLGGKGTITNMYKGMKADIARIVKKSTVRGGDAAKRHGIPVNSTNDTIKTTTASLIKEINESNLSAEQKLERIKEVRADEQSLYWHNDAMTAQKLAKKDNAYVEARENTFALGNKIKQNKDLTPEEIQKFHDLKPYEFDLMKAKLGASPNSRFGQMLDNQRSVYESVIEAVNKSNVYQAGGAEERNASIKLWMKVSDIGGQIRALKIQGEGSVVMEGVNKKKIADLKEKEKGLIEQLEQKGVEYDARLKELRKGEVEFAELMAAELDAGFKVQTEAEYLKAGGKKGSEGRFVREKGKRDMIYINETAALEARQLGVELHETTHLILKNSLKETVVDKKTGKEKEVVSKKGMIIIDQFLNELNYKERAAVEERMEESYRYEKYENGDFVLVNGKKIKRAKEDYYEEHITAFSDVLKNKEVKQTPDLARRIGDVFIPLLRKAGFKNLRAVGTNSGEGIYNMVKSLQVSSEKRTIDKDVLDAIKKTKKTTVDNIAESRTVTEAMKKASTEIDQIYEKEGMGGYNEIIERIKGKKTVVDPNTGEKTIERSKDFIEMYTKIYERHENYQKDSRLGYDKLLYDAMATDPVYGVLGSIMKYDASKGTTMAEHILGRLKVGKHIDVSNIILGKGAARQFTKKLDAPEAMEIESKEPTAEELLDIKLVEEQRVQAPNLRKSLKKGEEQGINQELIDKVENTVLKTFGTKLPLPGTKTNVKAGIVGFKKALNDSYKTELKTPIADWLGTGPKYEVALRENFEAIMKFVDKSYFVAAESQLPRSERVFTEVEIESMSTKQTDKAIADGRMPKNTSRTAGNTLWRFKKPAPAEFIKFFTPPTVKISPKKIKAWDKMSLAEKEKYAKKEKLPTLQEAKEKYITVGSGVKGTRKDRLAEILGIELAKDMTSQVLSRPEVIAKIKEVSKIELEGSIEGVDKPSQKVKEAREMLFDNYVERVASEMGKDPNQMFSSTEFKKEIKELRDLVESKEDFNDVFSVVLQKPIVKRANGEEFSKEAYTTVLEGYKNGLLDANVMRFANKLAAITGKKVTKGTGYELYTNANVSKQILSGLKNVVKIASEVTEKKIYLDPQGNFKGGKVQAPDFSLDWSNTKQIWELKYKSARTPKNSAGFVNYSKAIRDMAAGKEFTLTERKNPRENAKEEAVFVQSVKNAILKGVPAVEALLIKRGVLKKGEDFTSKTKIPLDVHNEMYGKEKALMADGSQIINGDWVAADYNKKGVFNFNMATKGAFYLGTCPTGIAKQAGATKLEGNFPLMTRVYSSSYEGANGKTAGYKYTLVGEGLISPKNITSKSTLNLDAPGSIKKMANTPAAKQIKVMAALEATALKANNKIAKKTKVISESRTNKEAIAKMKIVDKAMELGRKKDKKARGMSTFDFDETVGFSNNFVIARKGKKTKKIASDKWPFVGEKLVNEGWKMDFSDFNKVTGGKPGPLMQKMKNQIKKFGPDNVFILTARAKESAPAIHEYLKSEGIEIPLKNITGLGNSTGEAKAMWMLEKFSEGYNDMYFVDDALPNVKAVKNVLNQLDIKSKVQVVYSKTDFNKDINNIMESTFGIESKKRFSTAEGKVRGKGKKRRKFFMTDSASDLELLMEPMYGKGKKGIENRKWFEKNFYKPWERGINDLNTARQTILNDYMSLRKNNKDIVKSLDKAVEGTNFTVDQAARVYIWNKAGFEVPGLTTTSKAKLLEHVANNPKLQAYAENVAVLTKIETGLKQPAETWWAETIATEVQETGSVKGRDKYIGDWIERKNEIFSEENMAKMESQLGPKWRESLENMFYRMETGTTRTRDLGRIGNEVMNYLNGSVGAIMNLNTRSATLQLISSVNFINHAENNPFQAAKAFANQPQYWKDFMRIMNSDMLKQRRDGLQINVTEAELAAAVYGKGSKAKKALAWILKQGYIPTKIADSFAIASGGATYYRNRTKMYQKQGLSLKEAEAKAFIDFQGIAEKTQQSSRADLLSQQQTSFEGRLLLPFANTPMQMNRIMMKEMLDLSKGRYKGAFGENSFTNKASKIAYYGFVQSAIFAGLQSGLFALMANSDDEEQIAQKKARAVNTIADSFLRGMGIPGVVVSGIKNAGMKFYEQSQKGYGADYSEVGEALLNMSPTIGSKFSKLDAAGNTYSYNKKEILEKGLSLDNTKGIEAGATVIEAVTNIPIARVIRKTENIQGMLNEQNAVWQRFMMGLGWSAWDVGVAREKKEKKESNLIY